DALLDQGDIPGALQQLNSALQLADSVSNDRLSVDIGIDLGNASFAAGDAASALQQFADAEAFAASIPYAAAVAYARYNAALVLLPTSRLDEAAANLRSVSADRDVYLQLYIDLATADLAARRNDLRRALDMVENVRTRAETMQLHPAMNYALTRKALYL